MKTYGEFDETPIVVALLAQLHHAFLEDSSGVPVKVCTFIKQEGKLNVKSLKDMLVICVVMSMLNFHLLALKCTNIQFFIISHFWHQIQSRK
jgi:hypothetical protein